MVKAFCDFSSAWYVHTVVIHFFIILLLTMSHLSSENLPLLLVIEECLKDLKMSVFILFFRRRMCVCMSESERERESWSSAISLCVVWGYFSFHEMHASFLAQAKLVRHWISPLSTFQNTEEIWKGSVGGLLLSAKANKPTYLARHFLMLKHNNLHWH